MAITNPGASLRVMPQAPQINPRDFAPDVEGLQRAQLAGMQIGKEIADLSLQSDRLRVEKAKLKWQEQETQFQQQLAGLKLKQAAADLQKSERELNPMAEVDRGLRLSGADPALYGDDTERKLQDFQRVRMREQAFQADPTLTPELLQQRFGPTLVEEMNVPALPEGSLTGVEIAAAEEAPAPSPGLAGVSITVPQTAAEAPAAPAALPEFAELQTYRDRMVSPDTSPLQIAAALYSRDYPNRPLGALSAAERTAVLKPYLDDAKSEIVTRSFVSNGNSYKVDIRQSKDGQIVYEVSEPLLQRTAPETTATATVRNKLAFIDETDQRIGQLLARLDEYEKEGAFGALDTWLSTTAANPSSAIPVRALAALVSNPQTDKLVGDLAAIGAKTMTELAGATQTEGEARRLGPYVPAASDAVLGPKQLRAKVESFREQLRLSKKAIGNAFGLELKESAPAASAPAGAVPGAQRAAEEAISTYLQKRTAR